MYFDDFNELELSSNLKLKLQSLEQIKETLQQTFIKLQSLDSTVKIKENNSNNFERLNYFCDLITFNPNFEVSEIKDDIFLIAQKIVKEHILFNGNKRLAVGLLMQYFNLDNLFTQNQNELINQIVDWAGTTYQTDFDKVSFYQFINQSYGSSTTSENQLKIFNILQQM